ncbi:MAG: choice-of-anchor Q domain-containing protein [Planctomycetota bacterium]
MFNNLIGLDDNRFETLANEGDGIRLDGGASLNLIGDSSFSNVISGNLGAGIFHAEGSSANLVSGNIIGLDGLTGLQKRPNGASGVVFQDSPNNTVTDNTISGNNGSGVLVVGASASGNLFEGNQFGTDPTGVANVGNEGPGLILRNASGNTIGGGEGEGNLFAGNNGEGVLIVGGTGGNRVQGNLFGVSLALQPISNVGPAIRVTDSPRNQIGGLRSTTGNQVLSGSGVLIEGNGSTLNEVVGNSLGSFNDGSVVNGHLSRFGVQVDQAPGNVIGGIDGGQANHIGNVLGPAILITGASAIGNDVLGNQLGVNEDSTPTLGLAPSTGVLITDGSSDNLVGGVEPGEANVIGFIDGVGVRVESGTGNRLQRNTIFATERLPIDIGPIGLNENDPLDVDPGANGLQNAPVITSVMVNAGTMTVTGILEAAADETFDIELFGNADFLTYAGERFLGARTISTDDAGFGTFSITSNLVFPIVTATATDSSGNTSEFFTSSLIVNQTDDRPDADPTDGTADVDLITPGEQITLRSALEEASRRFGEDAITFSLPVEGDEPPVIEIESALPTIQEALLIDGASQPGAKRVIFNGGQASFSGLVIDDGEGSFEVGLSNLTVQEFQNGVSVLATRAGVILSEIELSDNLANGIRSSGSIELFGDNHFLRNGASGIETVGGAGVFGGSITVSNNDAFGLRLSGDAFLSSVTAEGNERDGIRSTAEKLELFGENKIRNNGADGIDAQLAVVSIESVDAINNVGTGISASQIVLFQNDNRFRVEDNGRFGVELNVLNLTNGGFFIDSDNPRLIQINDNASGIIQEFGEAPIVLIDATVSRNRGDGILSSGPVRLFGDQTEVSLNAGDGVRSSGEVTISGETLVHRNEGDGVEATEVIISSRVEVTQNDGAGIRAGDGGLTALEAGTLITEANQFGVNSTGGVTLKNAIVNFNRGDGIRTSGDADVSITGEESFILENGFEIGGHGIASSGDVQLENTTVTNNDRLGVITTAVLAMNGGAICGNGDGREASFADVTLINDSVICSLTVNNADDGGFGSLRNAVLSLNRPETLGGSIQFDPEAFGSEPVTINLRSELRLLGSGSINGLGSNQLTLDGNGLTRLFSFGEQGGDTSAVSLTGMTLRNGNANGGDGGAILAEDTFLRLDDVTIADSEAELGGAIALFEASDGFGYGGGSGSPELEITDSRFVRNQAARGGAIFTDTAISLERSTLDSNTASGDGGAISVAGTDFFLMRVRESTLFNNRAGGNGGAMHLSNAQTDSIIDNSTFSGNRADNSGGAIFHEDSGGEPRYLHVTITENIADADGDGSGVGGGFANDGFADVELSFSIIAGNTKGLGGSPDDLVGPLSLNSGVNLVGDEPLLGPLADNGGPTLTHALLEGSPAIDAAQNSVILFDQRRQPREDFGGIDLGAYERVFDFGDAPLGFPVSIFEDGARHLVSSLTLGPRVDAETDGIPNADAAADDRQFTDDEEGVRFRPAGTGFASIVEVTASGDGFLDAWIDFNLNQSWDDPGEQIFVSAPVTQGLNRLVFDIPNMKELLNVETLPESILTTARFRISSEGGLSPRGPANDGEVEDHSIRISDVVLSEDQTFVDSVLARAQTIYDPDVAVGYVYDVSSGPLFATLEILPGFGDDRFTLGIDDGAGDFVDVLDFVAGELIDFEFDPRLQAAGGLDRFRITGIELDANVDPADPLGFPTVLSFVDDGTVTFTQVPITEFVGFELSSDQDELSVSDDGFVSLEGSVLGGAGEITFESSIGQIESIAAGRWRWTFQSVPQVDDSQTVTVIATDDGGSQATTTFALRDLAGIEAITVGDGSDQRSVIRSLTVNFDSEVEIADGAFQLQQLDAGVVVETDFATSVVDGRTVAVLSFRGDLTEFGGSLLDGRYELAINGDLVTRVGSGNRIDANGDGFAGGERWFGREESDAFFRRFGDSNGDGDVNVVDLLAIRQTINRRRGALGFNAAFDRDGDGDVDAFDYLSFRPNFEA